MNHTPIIIHIHTITVVIMITTAVITTLTVILIIITVIGGEYGNRGQDDKSLVRDIYQRGVFGGGEGGGSGDKGGKRRN